MRKRMIAAFLAVAIIAAPMRMTVHADEETGQTVQQDSIVGDNKTTPENPTDPNLEVTPTDPGEDPALVDPNLDTKENSAEEPMAIVSPAREPEISRPQIRKISGGAKKISLSWTEASTEATYQVYMSERINGKYSKIATTDATKYTKTRLKDGKTYYFKVRAYLSVDGKNIFSTFSSVKNGKTQLATVYITPSGKCFHRAGCATLKRSKKISKISRKKAIAKKKKACKICKP